MSYAINSKNIYLSSSEINQLKNEFEKSKNIIGNIPDILLRAEIIKDKKKHIYFNISGFFDPESGFLKTLGEIYSRYLEIRKYKRSDIMPFHSLMMQPFEKIMNYLDIAEGSTLHKSLACIYSFLYGAAIGTLTGLLFLVNPILGATATIGAAGYMLYESYNANKHYKYKEYLENQGNLFVSKIKELFQKDYNIYILQYNCNIMEFIIDEEFNSIIDGIFNFSNKKSNSIVVNYWSIPEIYKAKSIKDYPKIKREVYSTIVERMRELRTDKDFFDLYNELHRKYHQTYKDSKELENKAKKGGDFEEIQKEIKRLKAIDENHPDIPKLITKLINL